MATINQLSAVDSLQGGDQIPVYDASNGDARKSSLTTLASWLEANLPGVDFTSRVVAPAIDGFNVDVGETTQNTWIIINPTAQFSTGSLSLPSGSVAVDNQEVMVVCTNQVNAFAVSSAGATVEGAPTELVEYTAFSFKYNKNQNTWYMLDSTGTGAGGNTIINRYDFTGDGVTASYSLPGVPTALGESVLPFIDGIAQEQSAFSVSTNTVTFSAAPPLNSAIEIVVFDVADIGATTANLVSYTQGGLNAVSRTVQNRLRETVSVKDFGAVGDGVTDDTAAIQAALDNGGDVFFPAGKYLITTLNVTEPDTHIYAQSTRNVQSAGVRLTTILTTGTMINVSTYGFQAQNINFTGSSDTIEKGSDITTVGISFSGASQKDIDSEIINCKFGLFNTAVVATGTQLTFEECLFSNMTYGFKTSGTTWENRAFSFANCRFHSMGKDGTTTACINIDPAHNVQHVNISGRTLVDDSMLFFNGMASGLLIDAVQIANARDSGITIDAAGHTVTVERRTVMVSNFSYHLYEYYADTDAFYGISLSGNAQVSLDGILINGSGGHGVVTSGGLSYQLMNIRVNDAGQFANDAYDGVFIGTGSTYKPTLNNVTVTQDRRGIAITNKARYGINLQDSVFSDCLYVDGPFVSGDINLGAGVSISQSTVIYETGSWTPSIVDASLSTSEGQTYSVQNGTYIRTGDLIQCFGSITMSSLGTLNAADGLRMRGLPFDPVDNNGAMTVSYASNLAITSGTYISGKPVSGTDRIELWSWDGTSGPSRLLVSELTSNGELAFCITYIRA